MGSIYSLIVQRRAQKNQNKYEKNRLQFALDEAQRNQDAVDENAPLIPRRAEESFSDRGFDGDTTFQQTGMTRARNTADRMIASAHGRRTLAGHAMSTFKKNLRHQRWAYYTAIGAQIVQNAMAGMTMGVAGGKQTGQADTAGTGGGDFGGGMGGDFSTNWG